MPGAAGSREAQTAPSTRPSHSRERLGGGISAPEQPLQGDGYRFRQGRAAPASCPSSETRKAARDGYKPPHKPSPGRARVRLREIRATVGGALTLAKRPPRPAAPPTRPTSSRGAVAPPTWPSVSRWPTAPLGQEHKESFQVSSKISVATTVLNQQFPASLPLLVQCFSPRSPSLPSSVFKSHTFPCRSARMPFSFHGVL